MPESNHEHARRWWRDVYRDAIWESEDLDSEAKAVAETYARHAKDAEGHKTQAANLSWVTYPRLMALAGIGRREGVSRAVQRLVDKGWLTVHHQVSRRATVYRITIPTACQPDNDGSSDGGTTNETTNEPVVPVQGSGSSVRPPRRGPGGSDGGTQPSLRPSKEPSSVVSPYVKRVLAVTDATDDEARDLIEKIKTDSAGKIEKTFGSYFAGFNDQSIVENLERLRTDRKPASSVPDAAKTPCPLHRGQPNAYTCGVCRSKILTGEDPYAGHEHLRPPGWWDKFPGANRLKPTTPLAVDTAAPDAPAPAQPEPASKPRPVRRCEHGRVAVNCPKCRTTALDNQPAPVATPEPRREAEPNHCTHPGCINGKIKLGINDWPCPNCSPTKPAGEPERLVLGELANARQETPRQRPPSQHQLAKLLGGLVKTID